MYTIYTLALLFNASVVLMIKNNDVTMVIYMNASSKNQDRKKLNVGNCINSTKVQ